MGFIGIVQVEDGKSRSGSGLAVNSDGSADVNIKSAPTLQVDGTVSVSGGSVSISGCVCSTPAAGSADTAQATASSSVPTDILAYDVNATRFMVTNYGATDIYLALGADATTNDYPVKAGGTFVLPSGIAWTGRVSVLGSSGGEDVRAIRWYA